MAEKKYTKFLAFHEPQLTLMGFPKSLHKQLYKKLKHSKYDSGNYLQILRNEDECVFQSMARVPIVANSQVFLIDHAWIFQSRSIYESLSSNEALLKRMQNMLQFAYYRPPIPGTKQPRPELLDLIMNIKKLGPKVDMDEYQIENIDKLEFGEDVEELSLWSNKISNYENLVARLKQMPSLKAVWLNENPVAETPDFINKLYTDIPHLQIINKQLTPGATEWVLKVLCRDNLDTPLEETMTLDLSGRRIENFHPDFLKRLPKLREVDLSDNTHLNMKDNSGVFIELFKKMQNVEYITADPDVEGFLWDQHSSGKLSALLPKLKYINNFALVLGPPENREKELNIRYVMLHLWKLSGSFRISNTPEPYWYLMDELGSAVTHSDIPNMAMAPFLYSPSNNFSVDATTLCIMWPIKDLLTGSILYKDFLTGVTEAQFRSARLSVWYDTPKEFFKTQNKLLKGSLVGHLEAEPSKAVAVPEEKGIVKDKMKVFTDSDTLNKYLTSTLFEVVKEVGSADIVWLDKAVLLQKK